MKRFGIVLTFFALCCAAMAQDQLRALPDDARYDDRVEFTTGVSGEQLPAMITALARSVGLTAVTDDVPPVTIVYDIGEPKPFRQVWNIVLTLNDLDYVLLDNDIVVVGTTASVNRLRAPSAPVADEPVTAALEQRFYRVNSNPEQVVDILERALPGLDVQALPGVSSIMVLGTEEDQARVQALLDQFDTAAESVELQQRTYFLSNAVASDLASVLQSTGVVAAGDEGASERLEDFTVIAEPRTNSIIVTGSSAVQARLAELIPQLDEARKQVNVQVRIQEVAHSVTYDLGLNLTGGFGQMAASILDTGLRFVFDAASVVSSFNIGAILNALETQGLSRRVDDGTITVLDNQTATMVSGGMIHLGVKDPATGEVTIFPIPYGVQLDITPRIGNDGSVTIDIVAKVEDRLPTSPNELAHLSTQSVSSTITLAPGQTALLGSLMQNKFKMTKNRVPILGAIPIIGELFGSTTTEDETTDLLLVITAQVLD